MWLHNFFLTYLGFLFHSCFVVHYIVCPTSSLRLHKLCRVCITKERRWRTGQLGLCKSRKEVLLALWLPGWSSGFMVGHCVTPNKQVCVNFGVLANPALSLSPCCCLFSCAHTDSYRSTEVSFHKLLAFYTPAAATECISHESKPHKHTILRIMLFIKVHYCKVILYPFDSAHTFTHCPA